MTHLPTIPGSPACLLMLALAGCSASQGYEFVQNVGEARAACEREPTVAAQRACEEAFAQDFETYRRERQAVVGGDTESSRR